MTEMHNPLHRSVPGGTAHESPAARRDRRARKTRVGMVVSDKMQKTVVVAIERRVAASGVWQDDYPDDPAEGA